MMVPQDHVGCWRAGVLFLLGASLIAAQACAGSSVADNAQSAGARMRGDPLRALTDAHTRVVWVQDDGTTSDPFSFHERLRLMGYDSDDGRGKRPILGTVSNYVKPLMTPKGNRVVFSSRLKQSVFVVNWDGSGLRPLPGGYALAVWRDPLTGTEWVYTRPPDPTTKEFSHRSVTRHQIDRPEVSELVWDKTQVSDDTFQLSRDGRRAIGLFPYPSFGVAELPNRSVQVLGEGCWTGIASFGDGHLCWVFDGAHRNVMLMDTDGARRWRVAINTGPGINGHEVYHPRWSNDPRLLTLTGPYTVGSAENKIRGGGNQIEIYVGKFSDDFTAVTQWLRVTDNKVVDTYPDVWVDPGQRPQLSTRRLGPAPTTAKPGQPGSNGPSATASNRVVVQTRLIETSGIPEPASIAPYRHALVANTYEILRVLEGPAVGGRILVAHWAIRDGRVLPAAGRVKGAIYTMTLTPFDSHPELEGQRLVMDGDPTLPLFYDPDKGT